MANKLYPPQIEGSLPAMYKKENGQIILKVPFQLNRAVSMKDITNVAAVIKTVSTGVTKDDGIMAFSFSNNMAEFHLDPTKYIEKQHYKVQIAFVNNDTIGYYSSVSVIKYVPYPTVSIDFDNNADKYFKPLWIGRYESSDPGEKIYSYCFTIYDGLEVFDTSGELFHDSSNDISSCQTFNSWTTSKVPTPNKTYSIQYKVKTVSGLEVESPITEITFILSGDFNSTGDFAATLYADDGYVYLHFNGDLKPGKYLISKSSAKENFEDECEFITFDVEKQTFNCSIFCDYSIEQGVKYNYKLYELKDNGLMTKPATTKFYLCKDYENRKEALATQFLTVDFEDAFLSDGERQLKIRYNPKVASFKSTILESKIDTLGGKYPTFFRNGNVEYKEFSISGLVSRHMDDNGKFMRAAADSEIGRASTPAAAHIEYSPYTNLDGENFYLEREFKMEVMKWLMNGKPKLFRSPGEGNYIVRTMNTSFSPNDTLGRMLHTFNCTAYEIAEFNEKNLKAYNLFGLLDVSPEDLKPTISITKDDFAMTSLLPGMTSFYNFGYNGGAYFIRFNNESGSGVEKEVYYYDGTIKSVRDTLIQAEDLANPIMGIDYKGDLDGVTIDYGYLYVSSDQREFSKQIIVGQEELVNGPSTIFLKELLKSDIRESKNIISIKVAFKDIVDIKYENGSWIVVDGITTDLDNTEVIYRDINNITSEERLYYYSSIKLVNDEEVPETEIPPEEETIPLPDNFVLLSADDRKCKVSDQEKTFMSYSTPLIISNPKIDTATEFNIGQGLKATIDYNTIITTYMLEMPPELGDESNASLYTKKCLWINDPSNQSLYKMYINELERKYSSKYPSGGGA